MEGTVRDFVTTQDTIVSKSAACASYKRNYVTSYITATVTYMLLPAELPLSNRSVEQLEVSSLS